MISIFPKSNYNFFHNIMSNLNFERKSVVLKNKISLELK